jgi:hypothetical protein
MLSETPMRINTPKVIYEIFDDEALLINLDNGNYYSVDSVGADILRLLEHGAALASLVESMVQRYEGSRAAIERGVQALLIQLEQEGLITPQDEPVSQTAVDLAADAAPNEQPTKSQFSVPELLAYTDMQDLIILDPIHEVDESGWPKAAQDDQTEES